jgi:hypothetical protein
VKGGDTNGKRSKAGDPGRVVYCVAYGSSVRLDVCINREDKMATFTKSKEKEKEKQDAIRQLKKWLKPGDSVYTVINRVSSSGMFRRIVVLIAVKKEIINISWYVARVCGYKDCDGSVGVGGCGMDMGFSVVYNLASNLWPKGDGKYITGRNGDTKPETDGGYCLKQHWV